MGKEKCFDNLIPFLEKISKLRVDFSYQAAAISSEGRFNSERLYVIGL